MTPTTSTIQSKSSSSTPMDSTSTSSLRLKRLEANDAFFSRALDWIPTKFLVSTTDEEREAQWRLSQKKKSPESKFMRNKKRKLDEIAAGKLERAAKRHQKFELVPTATRLAELSAAQKRQAQAAAEASNIVFSAGTVVSSSNNNNNGAAIATTAQELQERLARRLEASQKKAGVVGQRAERDKLLPAKTYREEKRAAAAAVAGTTTGAKPSSAETGEEGSAATNGSKKLHLRQALAEKISFGALAVRAPGEEEQAMRDALIEGRPKPKANSIKSIHSLKKMIKSAESEKARLAALKAAGQLETVEAETWAKLERRADGEHQLRDDPAALKKRLKQLEQKKQQSSEAWHERQRRVEKGKMDRDASREKHVGERKTKVAEQTLAKRGRPVEAPKTPRARPGFEGGGSGAAGAPGKKPSKSKD